MALSTLGTRTYAYTPAGPGTVLPAYDSAGLLHCLQRNLPAGTTDYKLFYLAGRPVAQVALESGPADRWWYFTTDHLGTPVVATDENQDELWVNRFDPFGEDPFAGTVGGASEQEVFLRFPGQWDDPVWRDAMLGAEGYQNVWRWYAAGTGRYSRSDPLGLRGSDALMLYGYAEANPLFWADPFGLCACNDDCPTGEWTYSGASTGAAFVGGIAVGTGFFQCKEDPRVSLKVKSVCAVIGLAAWAGGDLTTGLIDACNKEDLLGLSGSFFGGVALFSASASDDGSSGSAGLAASLKYGGGWMRCRITRRGGG